MFLSFLNSILATLTYNAMKEILQPKAETVVDTRYIGIKFIGYVYHRSRISLKKLLLSGVCPFLFLFAAMIICQSTQSSMTGFKL